MGGPGSSYDINFKHYFRHAFFPTLSTFWASLRLPFGPLWSFWTDFDSILVPFWLILASFGIRFSGLDFAWIFVEFLKTIGFFGTVFPDFSRRGGGWDLWFCALTPCSVASDDATGPGTGCVAIGNGFGAMILFFFGVMILFCFSSAHSLL